MVKFSRNGQKNADHQKMCKGVHVVSFTYLPAASYVVITGKSVTVIQADEIFLKDLVPALNNGSPYCTYQGSLTTPPCFQSVRWIVLTETTPFNSTQVSRGNINVFTIVRTLNNKKVKIELIQTRLRK